MLLLLLLAAVACLITTQGTDPLSRAARHPFTRVALGDSCLACCHLLTYAHPSPLSPPGPLLLPPLHPPPHPQVSPPARDLLKQMLDRNPAKRLRAGAALRHPWLQDADSTSALPLRSSVVQRLQRFATYGHLKQLVLRIIADDMAEHPTTQKESQVGEGWQGVASGGGQLMVGELTVCVPGKARAFQASTVATQWQRQAIGAVVWPLSFLLPLSSACLVSVCGVAPGCAPAWWTITCSHGAVLESSPGCPPTLTHSGTSPSRLTMSILTHPRFYRSPLLPAYHLPPPPTTGVDRGADRPVW